MGIKPTTALAIAAGYTHAVFATSLQYDLELLVQPDADLGERFRAFDLDEQQWLWVNGWMFDVHAATDPALAPAYLAVQAVDAELRAVA